MEEFEEFEELSTILERLRTAGRALQVWSGLPPRELTRKLRSRVGNETAPRFYRKFNEKTQERSVSTAEAGSAQAGKKNECHEGKPCTNSSGGLVACCIFCLVLL